MYYPHPVGIVIGSEVRIGENVTIYQNVTIGRSDKSSDFPEDYPSIGDSVVIYPGAVVVGNIRVGNNAVIGANTFVNKNVPENAMLYGQGIMKLRGGQ